MSIRKPLWEIVETAVLQGNLLEVERLTFDKRLTYPSFYRILNNAIISGQIEPAKLLINRGCQLTNYKIPEHCENEILHIAILSGNIELVELLIKHRVNIVKPDKDGIVPIFKVAHHLSDKYDLSALLNCLLEKGVSLDTTLKKNGFTILHYAVELGNVNIIPILIEKKIDLNIASHDGLTALHVATKHGRSKIVEILLKGGANSNLLTNNKCSPLYLAVVSGDLETFKILLNFSHLTKQSHNNENDRRRLLERKENQILVYLAAYENNIDILKILLLNGANVNFKSPDTGSSALHLAVKKSNIEMVELLVKYKASLNWVDKEGVTPLHWACIKGNLSIVSHLLKTNKCDLKAKTYSSGSTPFHLAVKSGHSQVFSLLLEKTIGYEVFKENQMFYFLCLALENIRNDMNTWKILLNYTTIPYESYFEPVINLIEKYSKVIINETGNSVLHIAVENEDEKAVDFLLKHQVCTNTLNKNNHTPFDLAIINGSYSIVNIFLQKTANLDSLFRPGKNGFTPLYIAVQKNDKKLVSLLLKRGAKVNVREKAELEIAVENGNEDILEMLLEASILPYSEWNGGYLVLCFAAYRGHERIVKMLLEKGVNPNVNLEKYLTPLHAAAQQGHENIVRLLLKNGVKVNPKQVTGAKKSTFISTPLLAASYANHWGIVQLLLNHGADFNAKLQDASDISISKFNQPSSTSNEPVLTSEQSVLMLEQQVVYFEKILIQGSYKDSEIRGEGTLIGYTCLHFAVEAEDEETVKLLINYGAVVNFETKNGSTAIGLATERANEEIIKHLLFAGAETSRNYRGASILEIGSLKTNVKIAEIIVKSVCSSQRFSNDRNFTPLGLAIGNKLESCVVKLLEDGANLEMEHKEEPLLHIAVRMENVRIIEMLLEYGVDINITNKDGETALLFACSHGYSDVADLLLDVGGIADIFKPLLEAIKGKYDLIVESFLKRGLVKCNSEDICPLRVAFQKSSPEVVQKLFEFRDAIENFDVNENMFIYNAIQGDNYEVLEFLLKKGFSLEASKNNGHYVLDTALKIRRISNRVFKLLVDYGVAVDAKNRKGDTPSSFILRKRINENCSGYMRLEELLKLFLLNGADPNQLYGSEKQTLLELAIHRIDPNCVKTLLLYGADINIFNEDGKLPLELALLELLKCPDIVYTKIINLDVDDWESTVEIIDGSPMLKVIFLLTQEVVRRRAVSVIEHANEVSIEIYYLKEYIEKCQQEIELMKLTKISERISYFDLFVASSRKLASLARNDKVRFILFPDSGVTELFPIYAEMLTARIGIGRDRRHLMDSSYHLLNKALCFNFPRLVVEYVFSYLADRDLRNLNSAFKRDMYF